ncbi:MAG: AI-2E family transporter [Gammaproteobacteria bacterium]|nr:AI-2E family transporter [Gammaproteobacteria bacterium]MCF6364015.1 AI-2E family transporter [Gammaproteobacteria bacterium]
MNVLRAWFNRNFSNPQTVILTLFLLGGFVVVFYMGSMLAPLLAAVVIAYLLEAIVQVMERCSMPRLPVVILVFLLFIVVFLFLMLWLVPMLSRQVAQLAQDLPRHIDAGQKLLMRLPEMYPQLFTEEQVRDIVNSLRIELAGLGQSLLALSLAWIPSLIALAVYLILVPMMVFFFLKDKSQIVAWMGSYLPRQRELTTSVWLEVDLQIGNYIRGKFTEILIIGGASYITFVLMGLNYAALLGALVGLSVVIPYIGATVVTIPVAMIAYLQWGWGSEFAYLMLAYAIIQVLDGNVVVPLLFSEAVNLHPVAIIVAVLVFGGLWGFWGVFFAIPLATLVKAVLTAWPKAEEPEPADA